MKLTKAQERAKAKLTNEWQSAYDLGESLQTLRRLVACKVAIVKRDSPGDVFFPRSAIKYKLSSNSKGK